MGQSCLQASKHRRHLGGRRVNNRKDLSGTTIGRAACLENGQPRQRLVWRCTTKEGTWSDGGGGRWASFGSALLVGNVLKYQICLYPSPPLCLPIWTVFYESATCFVNIPDFLRLISKEISLTLLVGLLGGAGKEVP